MSSQVPSQPIPGNSDLERAKKTIQIINACLPSPGDVRPPKGETDQVRLVLRHKGLRARVRPRQHPRIAAAFKDHATDFL